MIEPPTLATTRLDHIEANLAAIRGRVGHRQVLAAVKADAYGHGAVEVARMIEAHRGRRRLGVATVAEGVELREAGIGLPILKLSVARGRRGVGGARRTTCTLCVVDEASIATRPRRLPPRVGRQAVVHLKVDTGMRRIGCEPAAARGARDADRRHPGVRLAGLMSAPADLGSPSGDEFTTAPDRPVRRSRRRRGGARGPCR